jgi:hypothetical protein
VALTQFSSLQTTVKAQKANCVTTNTNYVTTDTNCVTTDTTPS